MLNKGHFAFNVLSFKMISHILCHRIVDSSIGKNKKIHHIQFPTFVKGLQPKHSYQMVFRHLLLKRFQWPGTHYLQKQPILALKLWLLGITKLLLGIAYDLFLLAICH